ncbi:unnamed protein product, partial [Gongylonema pulchrum]|uniref:ZM domain-containing protein n=1 Tax=Gongylonema pulchrum TaxID=637853 RepID=A0A183DKM5_9BILA
STVNSAPGSVASEFASLNQWTVSDIRRVQSENAVGHAYFGNPSQTSVPRQAAFALQDRADHQAQSQKSRPAVQPMHDLEPYLFSLQEYQAKNFPRSHDYLKSEESSAASEKPIAYQLARQETPVCNSICEISMPSNSLLREVPQKPPVTQSVPSQTQRNLLDPAVAAWIKATLVDLTFDIEDNQRQQLNYWPTAIDAGHMQRYDGHSCTGDSRSEIRANANYDNRGEVGNRHDGDSESTGH